MRYDVCCVGNQKGFSSTAQIYEVKTLNDAGKEFTRLKRNVPQLFSRVFVLDNQKSTVILDTKD